jgi:hypothetical protein
MLENSNTGPESFNSNDINNQDVIKVFYQNSADTDNTIDINANTGENILSSNTKAGDLTTGNIDLGINLLNISNVLMPNTLVSADIWNIVGPYSGDLIIPELANYNTGTDSNNQNLLNLENETDIDIVNNADLSNEIDITSNTGGNEIGSNTVVGDISTGDTSIKSALTNIANIAAMPVLYLINVFGEWTGSLFGLDPSQVIVNEINDQTGYGSNNQNTTNLATDTEIDILNDADVNNRIKINANTGNNNINNSTVVGDINTGDIDIATNTVNILNSFSENVGKFALRIINIFGDWGGNASNTPTGPVSTNNGGSNKNKLDTTTEAETLNIDLETQIEDTSENQIEIKSASTFNFKGKISNNSLEQEISNNTTTEEVASNTADEQQPLKTLNKNQRVSTAMITLAAIILFMLLAWAFVELITVKASKK